MKGCINAIQNDNIGKLSTCAAKTELNPAKNQNT